MTQAEISMNGIFEHDNGISIEYGTGEYWSEIASDTWRDNVNNVQSKYADQEAFINKFFEVALVKINKIDIPSNAHISTLWELYK